MDAREYQDGTGSVKVRAKIKVKDESTVVIKEIPPTTTTESLIASIEDAARKGKLKVKSHQRFHLRGGRDRGQVRRRAWSAEQLVDALYAFTDCEVTIASRIVVIRDNRPVEMTVSEVLRENTEQLVDILKRELELKETQAPGRTAFPHAGAHLHRGAHLQEDRAVQDQRGGAWPRCMRASSPSSKQLVRELTDAGRRAAARRCASGASRSSTSTSTARRWRRSRPSWPRRASTSRT